MIWDYGEIKPNLPTDPYRDALSLGHIYDHEYFQSFFERLQFEGNVYGTWRLPTWHVWNTNDWTFKERDNNRFNRKPDVSRWHHDSPPAKYIVLWATNAPSEYKCPSGVFVPEPFHLMVSDNVRTLHRTGRNGWDPPTRHFMRLSINSDHTWEPDLDKLIVSG